MKKIIFKFIGLTFLYCSPIALFCSKNGNGGVLFIIFLAIGGLFKLLGSDILDPTIRVKPEEWWETNYKYSLSRHNGKVDARADEIYRNIADFTTKANGCPMPSEEEKERIARSVGIVTNQMKAEERERWNRLQVGKFFLMGKLSEKYHGQMFGEIKRGGRWEYPSKHIDYSKNELSFALYAIDGAITKENIYKKYGMDDVGVWSSILTTEEKKKAIEWTNEYERRLLDELHNYIENGIKMHTIGNLQGRSDASEINRKYGFTFQYQED